MTIIYHSNYPDGTGEEIMTQTESLYSYQNVTLMKNNFTYEGYEFAGWSDEPDAPCYYEDGETTDQLPYANATKMYMDENGNFTVEGPIVIHLYAVWEDMRSTLTIVYHSNFPNGAEEQTYTQELNVNYSEPHINLMKNSFICEDYEFLGWCTDSSVGFPSYKEEESTSEFYFDFGDVVHLYAIWWDDEVE